MDADAAATAGTAAEGYPQQHAASAKDDAENAALWQRITLAAVLALFLLVGVPMWLRTTTVHRADLPLDRMLVTAPPQLVLPIAVSLDLSAMAHCGLDQKAVVESLAADLAERRARHAINMAQEAGKAFIDVRCDVSLSDGSDNKGAILVAVKPGTGGKPVAVQWDGNSKGLVLSEAPCDAAEFSRAAVPALAAALAAVADVGSSRPQAVERQLQALPASGNYLALVSLLVDEPRVAVAEWPIREAIDAAWGTALAQLAPFANMSITTQVLFHAHLDHDRVKVRTDSTTSSLYLTADDLRMFVNPTDWNLETTSTLPVLNFVIYVPRQEQQPLHIRSAKGAPATSDSFFFPRWGGVAVLNTHAVHSPSDDGSNHRGQRQVLRISQDSLEPVLHSFLSDLRRLLGVPPSKVVGISGGGGAGEGLSAWELDAVLRYRTGEYVQRAWGSLSSLATLLGNSSNMVIQDHLQLAVTQAIEGLDNVAALASQSRFAEAHQAAQSAFAASEQAFFDPSMLALLYFPDEHKFAIYMPLFLPVGVSVLAALLKHIKDSRAGAASGPAQETGVAQKHKAD